jgi:hypothetical protein
MAAKPEATSDCKWGQRYFCKNSWRRLKRDAKRNLKRFRRRMEKRDPDCPKRLTKGWAD